MFETERKKLIPYGIIAFLFLTATLAILFTVNPFEASPLVIFFFYFSLSCFFVCFLTIILYLARIKAVQLLPYEKMRIAVREAILLTILLVGSLFLSSKQLLYWWVEIVFIVAIVLIETFFLI